MSADRAAALLADLDALFAGMGLRWYLFGAQAAALYGNRRVTVDVDVTVDLGARPVEDLVDALRSGGFPTRVSEPVALARQARVVPVRHAASGMELDVVIAGSGLEAEFLERARRIDVGSTTIAVISPEDLIIAKVLAGRSNDLADVRGVLEAQRRTVDLARIREVLAALDAALDRSDLAPAFERLLAGLGRPG